MYNEKTRYIDLDHGLCLFASCIEKISVAKSKCKMSINKTYIKGNDQGKKLTNNFTERIENTLLIYNLYFEQWDNILIITTQSIPNWDDIIQLF